MEPLEITYDEDKKVLRYLGPFKRANVDSLLTKIGEIKIGEEDFFDLYPVYSFNPRTNSKNRAGETITTQGRMSFTVLSEEEAKKLNLTLEGIFKKEGFQE